MYSKRPNIGPADYWSLTLDDHHCGSEKCKLDSKVSVLSTNRPTVLDPEIINTLENTKKTGAKTRGTQDESQ